MIERDEESVNAAQERGCSAARDPMNLARLGQRKSHINIGVQVPREGELALIHHRIIGLPVRNVIKGIGGARVFAVKADKLGVKADTSAAVVGFNLHFNTLAKAAIMGLFKR